MFEAMRIGFGQVSWENTSPESDQTKIQQKISLAQIDILKTVFFLEVQVIFLLVEMMLQPWRISF